MFEEIFKIELTNLKAERSLIEKLWSEVQFNYTKSNRHYHNLSHLDNLIEQLLPIQNQIKNWPVLIFSVAYHDIIYNVLKKDNEERSAEYALERMALLNLASPSKEICKKQILATKHHQENQDADTNYFTDADLSILGSDSESYNTYTNQIRKEYAFFPDILYKPGRRKILEHFLKMRNIFKTEYFHDKFEVQAKINISGELKLLS